MKKNTNLFGAFRPAAQSSQLFDEILEVLRAITAGLAWALKYLLSKIIGAIVISGRSLTSLSVSGFKHTNRSSEFNPLDLFETDGADLNVSANPLEILCLSDIHMSSRSSKITEKFYEMIQKSWPDCLVITGDLANSRSLSQVLMDMEKTVKIPIYFVLGNNDYYGSSVQDVRSEIEKLCSCHSNLHWMGNTKAIDLGHQTLLTGHDTWADGGYTELEEIGSHVDATLIEKLKIAYKTGDKRLLQQEMKRLADSDVAQLEKQLENGLQEHPQTKRVIIMMHIPPYPECCFYEGKQADIRSITPYVSKTNGDFLTALAQKYPVISFIVLCGHTHNETIYQPPEKNLKIYVQKGDQSYKWDGEARIGKKLRI